MSTGNTETRILQMQLENKDFEEGVRQTIKSLENLEEKLNLKNAGDGFEKVSAAANSVQMSHLESGLDSVTNKFTLMGQIGLQVLERISSQVVDTGEKILRAATIQPMIDGWGEFEMKTNSVQTILGGIRHQFDDQPTAIHAISESLDELNEYADKTIYNFAQMTENVGKFTNQGIKLEESTNAIKGIANWAAAVGANPAQMSRAMYNISQSLGAGSMQLIDWRSIRFANMATPEVKELFVEVAKTMGMLDENGQVQHGKQVFDALNDFEASLKGKWLTNEVMAEAFSIYANAFTETDLIAKYGETLGKKFYEMGVYAEEAATKVRTFSQLIGVLKESLGSGWANTFDILFGGFEKQTEFLTAIKNRIEEIINFQTEDRNTWLQNFSDIGGIQVFQDAILTTLDILSDFYWVFNDVAALILNPFGSSVFNMTDGIFGPRQEGYTELRDTWKGVKGVFDDISNTLKNFRKWLYTPNEKSGRSPIHNLANALSGVAGAAGIAWQVLTGFGKFVFRIFKRFEPLVSSVLDLLGQIGGAIYNVFFNLTGQQSIEKVFDKIGDAIEPVIDFVVGLATAVVDLIHSFLGIDAAADDWTVLGERMKAFWEIFRYDPDLSFVDNFTNSLRKALTAVFGEETANDIIKAWDDNVAPVLEQISGFFTSAFADFDRVLNGLRTAAEADYSQATGVKGGIGTFLTHFLKGYFGDDTQGAEKAYTDILGIYHQLKGYYDQYVRPVIQPLTKVFTETLPNLNKKIIDFLFGKEMWVANEDTEFITKERRDGLISKIKEFFAGDEWRKISDAANAAIGWVKKAFDTAFDFLFGKQYDAGDGSKFRFGGMIQDIPEYFNSEEWAKTVKSVEEFFDPVIKAFDEAYKKIYAFLFGNEVIGKRGNTWREGGLFENITSFFSDKSMAETAKSIEDFFKPIIKALTDAYDSVNAFLFGKDVEVLDRGHWRQGHQTGLFEYFTSEAWQENWKLIQEGFENVKKWIEDKGNAAWNTIMTFLFGPETEGKEGKKERSGGIYQEAIKFLTPVWDWISSTGDKLYNYVTTHNFQQMWQKLNDLLFGYNEWVYNDQEMGQKVPHDGVLTPIVEMLQPIADVFNKVKGWALEKIGNIDWAGIWEAIGGFFTGYYETVRDEHASGNTIYTQVYHESIFERIANFFDRIIAWYDEHKGTFDKIFGWIGGLGGELWGAFEGLLGGKGLGGFESVGNYLLGGVNSLASKIFGEGFDLQGILNSLFGGGKPGEQGSGQASGTGAKDSSGGGMLGWIGQLLRGEASLFSSTANAAEADGSEIADGSNAIVATLNDTEKKTGSILDSVSSLLPYFGGAAAIGLVSKVGDMITGITGNRKPTIIEQISGLIRAIGEPLKGLGMVLAGAGFAEWISPGSIDKVFGHISAIMDKLFGWIRDLGLWGAGTTAASWLITGFTSKATTGVFRPNGQVGITSIIENLGSAIHGMMEGLQTLVNLALEVTAIDLFFDEKLPDGTVVHHFDERIQRVLQFAKDVLTAITVNWGTGLTEVFTLANTFVEGAAVSVAANAGNTDYSGGSGLPAAIASIAALVSALCDGVAAIMTASIVPGIMNVDTGKLVDIINAVMGGLDIIVALANASQLINGAEAMTGTTLVAKVGEIATMLTTTLFLASITKIAKALVQWYLELAETHLTSMGAGIYTFISNLTGALEALASLGGIKFESAEAMLKEDLPRLLGEITSDSIGFEKNEIDERGKTIRDFGDRVYNGISSLKRAKDIFDKYNTGDVHFPLSFFQEMTEALQYLQGDGIEELYDSVFGQEGFFVGSDKDRETVNGLSTFFRTLGDLGYVVTSYNEIENNGLNSRSGTKLESTKEGLDAFRDAFGGIQSTFHALVGDITTEGFSTEKIDALANFLTKIAEAGVTFSSTYFYEHGNLKMFETTSPIFQFASWLQTMGTGIRQLNDSLMTNGTYDINYTQIESALNSLKPMAEIEKTLFEYSTATTDKDGKPAREWMANTQVWIDSVLPRMKEIGTKLHEMAAEISPEDVASLNSASGALSGLASFMSQDLYTSITTLSTEQIGGYASAFSNLKQSLLITEAEKGSSIASMIQEVMNATGGKPVQVKITPILDDNANLPEGLSMEGNYGRTITMNMNMNDVVNVRIDSSQIQSLVDANHSTRDKLDSLARSISNIKVQINNFSGGFPSRSGRSVQTYPLVANYQNPYEIESNP